MTFNKCSINGKSYGDIVDESTGEVASAEDVSEKVLFDFKDINSKVELELSL